MRSSRKFWLVFAIYLVVVLLVLGVPEIVRGVPVGMTDNRLLLGVALIFVGAAGGVGLKRRDPVLASGLLWGVIAVAVALGLPVVWVIVNLAAHL
jgi:hypothetical protein